MSDHAGSYVFLASDRSRGITGTVMHSDGSRATSGTSRRPRPNGPASESRALLSLVHVLEWRAAVNPDVTALTDHQGAELTYAGLAAAVQRSAAGFAAAGFAAAGVAPGDVVPVIARNATGKVLRATLREPFWAGRDRRVS